MMNAVAAAAPPKADGRSAEIRRPEKRRLAIKQSVFRGSRVRTNAATTGHLPVLASLRPTF